MNDTTPLVFVDTETTGFEPGKCRMIEVAAIRVEKGVETARVVSFLKIPDPIPEHITKINGITDDMLVDAPMFADVAPQLVTILEGAIFVAHNAKFDYDFFVGEFARINQPFTANRLCTVELARVFYPQLKNHKLQTLIETHGYTFNARHRAEDDALVLQQFLQRALVDVGEHVLYETARRVLV